MDLPGIDQPATWLALASLAAMEIVLGIDNIVFISILTSRLPEPRRTAVARLGIGLSVVMRIALLFSIGWIMGLTEPLFTAFGRALTGRDLILLGGGLFLMGKATHEIYSKVELDEAERAAGGASSERVIIAQILALDVVFSLDSVITAVGMIPPDRIWVMVTAIVIAIAVMLAGAKPVSAFVLRHPSVKILALAFLLLIGVFLVADGLGQGIPKGYVYFAMAFSLAVELLNLRFRAKKKELTPR